MNPSLFSVLFTIFVLLAPPSFSSDESGEADSGFIPVRLDSREAEDELVAGILQEYEAAIGAWTAAGGEEHSTRPSKTLWLNHIEGTTPNPYFESALVRLREHGFTVELSWITPQDRLDEAIREWEEVAASDSCIVHEAVCGEVEKRGFFERLRLAKDRIFGFRFPLGFTLLKHFVKTDPETGKILWKDSKLFPFPLPQKKYENDHEPGKGSWWKSFSGLAFLTAGGAAFWMVASTILGHPAVTETGTIFAGLGNFFSDPSNLLSHAMNSRVWLPTMIVFAWVWAYQTNLRELADWRAQGGTVTYQRGRRNPQALVPEARREVDVAGNKITFTGISTMLEILIGQIITATFVRGAYLQDPKFALEGLENGLLSVYSYAIPEAVKDRWLRKADALEGQGLVLNAEIFRGIGIRGEDGQIDPDLEREAQERADKLLAQAASLRKRAKLLNFIFWNAIYPLARNAHYIGGLNKNVSEFIMQLPFWVLGTVGFLVDILFLERPRYVAATRNLYRATAGRLVDGVAAFADFMGGLAGAPGAVGARYEARWKRWVGSGPKVCESHLIGLRIPAEWGAAAAAASSAR